MVRALAGGVAFGISLCSGNRSVRAFLKHILPLSHIFPLDFFGFPPSFFCSVYHSAWAIGRFGRVWNTFCLPATIFCPQPPPLQCLTKLYCSRICIPKGRTTKSPKNFNLTLLTAVGARLDWMKIRWKRLRNHYGFQSIVRIVFRCRQYFSYWISSDLKRRTRSKCACRSAMPKDAKACDTDLLFWTAERK